MINYTLYLLIGLLILYVIMHYSTFYESYRIESFDNLHHKSDFYGTKYNKDEIYDDFYTFFVDDLFFHRENMETLAAHILNYQNNVYNNHLVLGMKHGGHLNIMIDNILNTQSAIDNKYIYKKCKLNYKEQHFNLVENLSSLYTYEPYTFTHISIIDDELYIVKDVKGYIYNCSEWLIHKGYLFLECYDYLNDFFLGFHKYNLHSQTLNNYVYGKNLIQHSNSNNKFTLVEKLSSKYEKHKKRLNHIEVNFYTTDYLIDICEGFGLLHQTSLKICDGKSLLVFQKKM